MPKRTVKSTGFLSSFKNKLSDIPGSLKTKTYPRVRTFIKNRPMASFLIGLGLLLLIMILNSVLTPKPEAAPESNLIKGVKIYKIGSAARASFSAKVEKEGVIQIVAQTPGIVSNVNVYEGQEVGRGTNLASLASNYAGGNAFSVSRQLAQLQYQNVKDTYDTQKEIIGKQKEIATKTDQNADELRAIADRSINETNDVINLNNQIIADLQAALDAAIAANNQADIASIRPLLLQARSANLQLNQASRSAQFQAAGDKPPAQLSDLGREITVKQLEIQEKALDLSREVSRLQLVLAQISESSMYPSSPCTGIVERVHVAWGQSVNPGAKIATISCTKRMASATAEVPYGTASKISKIEESTLFIGNKTYKVVPEYVSSEAMNGVLASVMFNLPDEAYEKVVDGGYIKVEIPIGYADTISAIPYLPIDIVFQTQDGAYVYLIKDGKVESQKIELGDVVGSNVAVVSGLADRDQVILNRNVIEGEGVRVE